MGPGPEFDLVRRFLAAGRTMPGVTDADDDPGTSGAEDDTGASGAEDDTGASGAEDDTGASGGGEFPGHPGVPDPGGNVRVGPGDDCAVITGDGIAVTVDMAMEDVHFRRAWLDPDEIGWRAAAAGLSDLAGMAARPIGVLASIALPPGDEDAFGEAVMRGVTEAAAHVGAVLLGGDTIRSTGPLVLDIVALGEAASPVLRKGALLGDEVWVTGVLGGAAAAVRAWERGEIPEPAHRAAYARPRPRVREALWLANRGVPAALMDLSDGLAGDAGHMAAASGVGIRLQADSVPRAPGPDGDPVPVALAAAGGEDYELCLVARPGAVDAVRSDFEARFDLPLTRVGHVREGSGVKLVDCDGRPMELKGWQHWGG